MRRPRHRLPVHEVEALAARLAVPLGLDSGGLARAGEAREVAGALGGARWPGDDNGGFRAVRRGREVGARIAIQFCQLVTLPFSR